MGLWSSVGSFGDETYGDVKTSGDNARGRIVQGRNLRGCNERGRIVRLPSLIWYLMVEWDCVSVFLGERHDQKYRYR